MIMTKNDIRVTGRIRKIDFIDSSSIRIYFFAADKGRYCNIFFKCPKELLPKDWKTTYVTIHGHIDSNFEDYRDKDRVIPLLVADQITPVKTDLEKYFGVKGKYCYEQSAIACFSGEILEIRKQEAWSRYIVLVGKRNVASLDAHKTDYPFAPHDWICAFCKIRSSERQVGGILKRCTSFKIEDIAEIG